MRSRSQPAGKLTAGEICILALIGAMMFVSKMLMAALPNIHLNAVLIILVACFFGIKALYSVAVYIMLEGLIFGFGLWWLSYLYIWPAFTLTVLLFRKNDSALVWAVVAAVFGLCFGALCSIPYFFMGGAEMGFSYWISGIPFDLSHCAGNFVTTLVLYKPLSNVLKKLLHA